MKTTSIPYYFLFTFLLLSGRVYSQLGDSTTFLKKVTISAAKKKNTFTAITPAQSLSSQTLQQINAQSVGDAARYFSGVLVKDYGGVGGLKTVSVRSLGASHTGINYDGIPVSDAQSGQIDLSRYSTTFVQSLDLQQANAQELLQPARAYGYGAVISINTQTFTTAALQQNRWQAGLKSGSFGLWQPFAGMSVRLPKNTAISINTEALFSKGDYPFYIDNGSFSEHTNRQNSDMRSFQGEANVLKMFTDSSTLQVKLAGYHSSRGLPGAVVFFNDRSVQHLWNTDYYLQSRYRTYLNRRTGLLFSGKFTRNYTKYTDPDYLNNQGGLDNRYTQHELYLDAALSHAINDHLAVAASSDFAFAWLSANLPNFANPSRRSFWNNVALNYSRQLWQASGSLLLSTFVDHTQTGTAAGTTSKLTPTIAFSGKPSAESPFMFRAFYKHVFRMPTFNDLYYNMIGNSSLKPEYARQYNAGIVYAQSTRGWLRHFNISLDGYYNTVKDKIIAIPNKNLFVWTMLNLGKVDIKGIDVTAEANGLLPGAIGWFTRIAYTWQQALDMTDATTVTYKNRIPYTPDHSGSGLVSFQYRQWSAGYGFLFSGTRYALGENNAYNQLSGWGTHDVFVAHLLKLKTFQANIKAELNNLSNKYYDIVRYFPMPGRSYKISLLLNNL